MTRKILVVDDEESILTAIKAYLESLGYQVTTASSGHEALTLFETLMPDLILLDLMMPEITGEAVCKAIRARSRIPIIMLTAKAEEENIIDGLGLGADDYVTKPFRLKELAARIEAVLRRSSQEILPLAHALVMDEGRLVIDGMRHEVYRDGNLVALTAIEMKLLMTLAKYPTKVFTREELITIALGDDFDGYDRTIDSHIKNIRLKLEEDTKTPRYIITVHGVGYRFGNYSVSH